jgi:hypothetical protein
MKIAWKWYHWVHVSDSVKTSTVRFFLFLVPEFRKIFHFLLSIFFYFLFFFRPFDYVQYSFGLRYTTWYVSLLVLTSSNSSICRSFGRDEIKTFLHFWLRNVVYLAKFCEFSSSRIISFLQISSRHSNFCENHLTIYVFGFLRKCLGKYFRSCRIYTFFTSLSCFRYFSLADSWDFLKNEDEFIFDINIIGMYGLCNS